MKMTVFWDVAPCSLVEDYRRFRGACCLHHQGDEWEPASAAKVLPGPTGSYMSNRFLARGLLIALMMEASSTSETSVNFYQTTRSNIPEDSHLLCREAFIWKDEKDTGGYH
jgi:hypothetical protein